MLIAQKKRKENIAEYILYLYQVEDLIRAFNLDPELISRNLVERYNAGEAEKNEISAWYENLALMMEKEGKKEKGHLQFLSNLVNDLDEFHTALLSSVVNSSYIETFRQITGLIAELKRKNPDAENDVQVAFDGVYGYLLLKIQKKEITSETKEAVKLLSHWLSMLSKLFRDFESGNLEI